MHNILAVRTEAEQLLRHEKYADALPLYEQLTAHNPYDSELKLQLACCAAEVGELPRAIEMALEALALGCLYPWQVRYEVAKLYARLGDKEASLAWLEQALSTRFGHRSSILGEELFKPFHDVPQFLEMACTLNDADINRDIGWRRDLDILVSEAQRLHVGLDRPAFSEQFLAMAAALHERIPSLSDEQIVVEMQRLLARLGDGHSQIYPQMQGKANFTMLPIDLYRFSDGLFIIDGVGAAQQWLGGHVTRIGSTPVAEIWPPLADFVSADNQMNVEWSTGPTLLTVPAYLHALGVSDHETAAVFTIEDRQGGVHQAHLTGGPLRERTLLTPSRLSSSLPPLYLRNTDANIWLQRLDEVNALYVQFNRVRDNAEQSIEAFAKQLLTTIRITQSQTVIVDVRHNGGGNNRLNLPLLRTLIHFVTDDAQHRLFVLIGRHTFSACQNFVNELDGLTDAIFVGEPTGSRPNMVGESTGTVLPYSGIRATISSWLHYDSFWADHRPWIAPQIPVVLSSEDYFSNQDPVLDTVLDLLH